MPKTCEKPFHKTVEVVLCKNPPEKTPNIREIRRFSKSAILQRLSPCKGYSLCKMVSLGQKRKMPKTREKLFYKSIRVVSRKKTFLKTPNIREFRPFGKSAILQRLQPIQGYRLCKMVSLGQKLKMPKTCKKRFYKRVRDVLWKKNRSKRDQIFEE